ncbi:HTTM domain-containing protein [Nonomuraea angiospora]|uniref:Antimicrobial peptide system SdpB family protein n=1 Tax=Nonomuraea angiospora TaxID=46172 RepID=A0ABR9MAT8_9ACTN|nr:HTTM domain-containing protein [Nonomuraea angiospora]MBE1590027.1 antimicrobial peptide system SdpB family protein [Nonomuraea angiospora]
MRLARMSGVTAQVRERGRERARELAGRGWELLERVSGVRYGLYGLAVLRIGYGLVLLAHLLVNYVDRRVLWGPESPWTPKLLKEDLAGDETFSVFAFSDSGPYFEVVYHLFIVIVVAFVVGWRTRFVTPLLAVMVWSWHEREPWILDGGDNIMQLVLIYACFAQLSGRWSLDARRLARKGWVPAPDSVRWRLVTVLHNSALLACLLQVSILYMNAGLLKVRGEMWQEGTALYYTLQVEEFQPFPWLSRLVYENDLFVTAGTYAAVLVQVAFPLLMLNPISRRLGLVAVTGMHLGIGLFMGLSSFSLIMITSDLLFVRGATYQRAGRVVKAAYRWVRSRRRGGADGGVPVAVRPEQPLVLEKP